MRIIMNQPSGFGDGRNDGTKEQLQQNLEELKQAVGSPLGLLLAIQQQQQQQQQQQPVSINVAVPQSQSQSSTSHALALVQQYLLQYNIALQQKQQREREQQAQQQRLESLLIQNIGLLAAQPQPPSAAAVASSSSTTSFSQDALRQLRIQQLQNALLGSPVTALLRAETNQLPHQQQLLEQMTTAATSDGITSQASGIGAWSATSALALRDMTCMTKSDKTVDCPIKSKKMNTMNKDQDKNKPKRPLSAYNIFFKEERQRILQSIPDDQAVPSTDKRKRKKTPHGKIGFQDLARMIGKRWNELKNEELEYYRDRAIEDSERYKRELAEYSSKDEFTEKISENAHDESSSSSHRIAIPKAENDKNND